MTRTAPCLLSKLRIKCKKQRSLTQANSCSSSTIPLHISKRFSSSRYHQLGFAPETGAAGKAPIRSTTSANTVHQPNPTGGFCLKRSIYLSPIPNKTQRHPKLTEHDFIRSSAPTEQTPGTGPSGEASAAALSEKRTPK